VDRNYILLVEDNAPDVYLIQEALREHKIDCDVKVLSDGEQVEEWLQAFQRSEDEVCPDLVLLDLNLPKVNGLELLSRFRALEKCRDVPIAVLTSSDSPEDRARAEAGGADRYLWKPFTLDEFLEIGRIVKQLLGSRRQSAAT
jgi:CheY-like chemotaxis protein